MLQLYLRRWFDSLAPSLPMDPTLTHTPSFLRTFSLSLRKVAIAVHLSQSGEKGPPVLFFFPPKFHPHVIIRIKKEYSAYINGRPLSLYPLWTHRSSSSAVSCDMRYTDQCNGISGSLAAHLPFSFYPVSMSQETTLNRSSLEAEASQERLPQSSIRPNWNWGSTRLLSGIFIYLSQPLSSLLFKGAHVIITSSNRIPPLSVSIPRCIDPFHKL